MPRKPMLTVREALDFLLAAARPVAATSRPCPTLEANGRVLAADQRSQLDVPSAGQHPDGRLRGARRRLRQRRARR